jgi:hypothetical protein
VSVTEPKQEGQSAPVAEPGNRAAQLVSTAAAASAFLCFGGIAFSTGYLGHELDCFPAIKEWIDVLLIPGVAGFMLAATVGTTLVVNTARGKVAASAGRFLGFGGAVLVFVLLSTPFFGDPIRYLFGMSSSHGPRCHPRGWLGESDPEAWKHLMHQSGGKPRFEVPPPT